MREKAVVGLVGGGGRKRLVRAAHLGRPRLSGTEPENDVHQQEALAKLGRAINSKLPKACMTPLAHAVVNAGVAAHYRPPFPGSDSRARALFATSIATLSERTCTVWPWRAAWSFRTSSASRRSKRRRPGGACSSREARW